MAKFKLTKRPETIAHTVRTKDVDGKELTLKVVYKYRGRSDFAALADAQRGAGLDAESHDSKMTSLIDSIDGPGAEFLLDILDSWDLEEELNLDNARLLIDQHQAVATAIISDYRILCLEGRLGN